MPFVDGTVTLQGGTVNINPGTNVFGILQILGTTNTNAPTLNVGSATLNFKVGQRRPAQATLISDQLIVGNSLLQGNMKGNVNFGYSGGSTTVGIQPQGDVGSNNAWQIIFFGTVSGDVTLNPATGFTKNWSNPNCLTIEN